LDRHFAAHELDRQVLRAGDKTSDGIPELPENDGNDDCQARAAMSETEAWRIAVRCSGVKRQALLGFNRPHADETAEWSRETLRSMAIYHET
jgi:hypothetical protein